MDALLISDHSYFYLKNEKKKVFTSLSSLDAEHTSAKKAL